MDRLSPPFSKKVRLQESDVMETNCSPATSSSGDGDENDSESTSERGSLRDKNERGSLRDSIGVSSTSSEHSSRRMTESYSHDGGHGDAGTNCNHGSTNSVQTGVNAHVDLYRNTEGDKESNSDADDEWTLQPSATVYAFGSNSGGQLGLSSCADVIFDLVQVKSGHFGDSCLRNISAGSEHTLFLTSGGAVVSAGRNGKGQRGPCQSGTNPGYVDIPVAPSSGQVHGNAQQWTASVAGDKHSAALNKEGLLYTWGDNSQGQLGQGRLHTVSIPAVVGNMGCNVVQVACGSAHTVALSRNGAVYTWGDNHHGQLGHGSSIGVLLSKPKCVDKLNGIPLRLVVTGGDHTLALTHSGALFAWGKNSHGQLGTGDLTNKAFPCLCRSHRGNFKIKHVACGNNHSAFLTQDGGLFTFGSAVYGQLGHGSTANQTLPKKVAELMGSEVIQVACGRHHTLALTKNLGAGGSGGRVFSFGLGSNGQLGPGSESVERIPWALPWKEERKGKGGTGAINHVITGMNHGEIIIEIFAGGDCSFIVCHPIGRKKDGGGDAPSNSSCVLTCDYRVMMPPCVATVTSVRLQSYKEFLETRCPQKEEKNFILPSELNVEVTHLFSSLCCINGSFLLSDDQHYACGPKNHGVDLDSTKEAFEMVQAVRCPALHSRIAVCLTSALEFFMPNQAPVDPEALRLFLILPFFHLFSNLPPGLIRPLPATLSQSYTNLHHQSKAVLGKWWLTIPNRHFRHIIGAYKSTVEGVLKIGRARDVSSIMECQHILVLCMEMLAVLFRINMSRSSKLSHTEFYMPALSKLVSIREDYCGWVQQQSNLLSFCNYPFVFDADAKALLLQADANMKMKMAVEKTHRKNILNIQTGAASQPDTLFLVLRVSRSELVRDTLRQLLQQDSCNYRKPLQVIFDEEAGIDEGGVKKEFFLLLLRDLLQVSYGMFEEYSESRLLWFCRQTFESSHTFDLIGVLCGLAIYNNIILALPFPLALFKKLLDKPLTLDDVRELDPTIGRSLQDVLDYEGEDIVETYCLMFEVQYKVFDTVVTTELVAGGSSIPVTQDNKQKYVEKYISFLLDESVDEPFRAFYKGFHRACGGKMLELFEPIELQAMITGSEEYDWDILEKTCVYIHGYTTNSPPVRLFWSVFHQLSLSQKKKFLMFLTGSDRVPTLGMTQLQMRVQPMLGELDKLPAAHTCYNLLDLPMYETRDQLHTKLLIAIENSEGFGLA